MDTQKQFKILVEEEFGFLREHGFSSRAWKAYSTVCHREYSAEDLGIRIELDQRDGLVFVHFCKVAGGELLDNFTSSTGASSFNCFELADLLEVRAPQEYSHRRQRVGANEEELRAMTKNAARLVVEYAGDLLEGDTSFFPAMEELLRKRAKLASDAV